MVIDTVNYSKVISEKIAGFRAAWNINDLGALHTFVSKGVVCTHPAVSVGFVDFVKGNYKGNFEVLKFWKESFIQFNTTVDQVEVRNVEDLGISGYKVDCVGHYPKLELSGSFSVLFNSDFIIDRIDFTRFRSYRAEKNISKFGLALKYLKFKIVTKN